MSSDTKLSNVDLLERTIKQAKLLSEEISQLTIELNRSKKLSQSSGFSSESVTRSFEYSESTTQSAQGPSTPQRSSPQSYPTNTPIAAVSTPRVSASNSDGGSPSEGRGGPIVKTTTTVITTKDRDVRESQKSTRQFESPSQTSPRRRIVHKRVVRRRRNRRGTSPWSPWRQTAAYTEDREKDESKEKDDKEDSSSSSSDSSEEEGNSRSETTRGRSMETENDAQLKKNDDERAYLQAEIARLMKVEARLRKELEVALEQERELEREMSSSKRREADENSVAADGEKVRARLRAELAELIEMERDLEERIRRYTTSEFRVNW